MYLISNAKTSLSARCVHACHHARKLLSPARPQFCELKTDWDVYKHITNLPDSQLNMPIFRCDDYVQTSPVNFTSNFVTLSEDQLLTILENIVTQQSNPAVHRLKFSSITQSDNEPIKDFVIQLK